MNPKFALWTRRFIFIVIALVAIYDIFVAAFGGPGTTVSLQGFCETGGNWRGKTLTLAVGYFIGHVLGRIDGRSA